MCILNSLNIRRITNDLAEKNRSKLAEYYYENSKACSSMENFQIEDAQDKIDSLIMHIKDNTALCYGAFDSDLIIGYIWAYITNFREEERLYISEIFIEEKYRSKGIGKELIQIVEKEAVKRKIDVAYIHAEARNTKAIDMYVREGFEFERIQLRKVLTK